MKARIARKIVKNQRIACTEFPDGGREIVTQGRKDYGRGRYEAALRQTFAREDRRDRWAEYTREKRKLELLPADQYEKAIRALAERLGI